MATGDAFLTKHSPTWCPGCGNFSIWIALRTALANLGFDPHSVVVSYGVGCSGNENNFVGTYAFHGLHGRPMPVGIGIKLANHALPVIVSGGDGDGYGEGLSHFLNGMRGNIDITYLVHDNQIYGLTTGQNSPTTEKGVKSKTNPGGVLDQALPPLALSLHGGATFVARAFSGNAPQLIAIIEAAIKHKGFAHVDILQPCVTFNKLNTYSYFYQRVYDVAKEQHDPTNFQAALTKAQEWGDHIPTGILYQIDRPTLEDQLPVLQNGPLVSRPVEGIDITKDMTSLI